MRRTAIQIVLIECTAVAILLFCWLGSSRPHPTADEIAAAQDRVYEAAVRDMVKPATGRTNEASQLVFADELLTGAMEGTSCPGEVIRDLRLERSTPPYNTIADKLYRVFTLSSDNQEIRPDAVQNFTERYCTGGRLSETFHTDLPRTFIKIDGFLFALPTNKKTGPTLFHQRFPGADGIIIILARWFRFRSASSDCLYLVRVWNALRR